MPLVSVIIPTHTGGPLVREAVASIRAQTLDSWEVKVVCDGCEDPLADLAGDRRVEIIHQPRSGVAIARNVGFQSCSGELVTFMDHDDIMFPQKLAAQAALFERDPGLGLCHTQFEQVDESLTFLQSGHAADVQYVDLLQCRYSMLMSMMMVSREAMESVGGFDPKSKAEDIDFALKVARSFRMAFIPEVHLQYRRHSQSISGDPWVQFTEVDYVLRGFRRYLEDIGETDALPLLDRGCINNRRVNAEIAITRARSSYLRGGAGALSAAKYLAMALYVSPHSVAGNARAFVAQRRVSAQS